MYVCRVIDVEQDSHDWNFTAKKYSTWEFAGLAKRTRLFFPIGFFVVERTDLLGNEPHQENNH